MNFPFELRLQELEAIKTRRNRAGTDLLPVPPGAGADKLPADTVGLALSGGGIRSATLCLGVLQSLAKAGRLRYLDYMSTVSGGGYIGSFVGRLFTREVVSGSKDPCGRVEAILKDNHSPQIQWLRKYANYIDNNQSDFVEGLGVFWRNLTTIYMVLMFLGAAAFGLLRVGGDRLHQIMVHFGLPPIAVLVNGLVISHWWPLPIVILMLAVIPCSLAFWLAPEARSRADFSVFPTIIWALLLATFVIAFSMIGAPGVCGGVLIILVCTPLWLETARQNLPPHTDRSSLEPGASPGVIIRNRLTRDLGKLLTLLFGAVLWVLLDSLALTLAAGSLIKVMMGWGVALTPAALLLRKIAASLLEKSKTVDKKEKNPGLFSSPDFRAGLIAFPLAAFLLVLLNGGIHWVFDHNRDLGFTIVFVSAAVSLCLGPVFQFLNYSSLQQTYASRLSRTFLGASNPARLATNPQECSNDVTVTDTGDDLSFEEYHPEQSGSPLCLINMCINETVDAASQRDVPDSYGLSMCVGPCGVSVGRRFHALWCKAPSPPAKRRLKDCLRDLLLPTGYRRGALAALKAISRPDELFHVLRGKTDAPVMAERLTIGRWSAISGAALATGSGRTTSFPMALLLGMANIRLGYWWDSGLSKGERPGQYHSSVWERLKRLPHSLFPMQSLLLSEFQGRFGGPSYRRWNLSDGGFFDMTGMYELLRRRLPVIIAVDAGCDPSYSFEDLAELVRLARIDFGATIEFLDGAVMTVSQRDNTPIPSWFAAWMDPNAFGKLSDIGKAGTHHATLARATYADAPGMVTWIVFMKSSLTGDEPVDVTGYATMHPSFPDDATTSQFFNQSQWESYRMLGEHIGTAVFPS